MAATATTVEATFVAFESLTHKTPPTSRTGSRRCGSARKDLKPRAMANASDSRPMDGQRTRQRVRDVVCAQQGELDARQEHRVFQYQRTRAAASYQASAFPSSENCNLAPATPLTMSSTARSSPFTTQACCAPAFRKSSALSA